MLVLSRRPDERIRISDNITITVIAVQGGRVRLGIDAPRDIPILRSELQSPSADGVDATNVNQNAVTDRESKGGGVVATRITT